jgi:hypothetical protein
MKQGRVGSASAMTRPGLLGFLEPMLRDRGLRCGSWRHDRWGQTLS